MTSFEKDGISLSSTDIVNSYTLIHLLLWFFVGRFTRLPLLPFLILTSGWELLEVVLPFHFAEESIRNKVMDMVANVTGYAAGRHLRRANTPVRSPRS